MPSFFILLVILLVILLLFGVVMYNHFIRLKNMVREAWSDIDVQLKRRADLLPNLVQVVSGYAQHERTTLEEVTQLRAGQTTDASVTERSKVENALTRSIKSLFAVAEAYPDLKANEVFLSLQHTLVEVEDQIQYARRYYNGATRDFNILLQSFPSNIIASMCQFTPFPYFEIELSTERTAPEVKMS